MFKRKTNEGEQVAGHTGTVSGVAETAEAVRRAMAPQDSPPSLVISMPGAGMGDLEGLTVQMVTSFKKQFPGLTGKAAFLSVALFPATDGCVAAIDLLTHHDASDLGRWDFSGVALAVASMPSSSAFFVRLEVVGGVRFISLAV